MVSTTLEDTVLGLYFELLRCSVVQLGYATTLRDITPCLAQLYFACDHGIPLLPGSATLRLRIVSLDVPHLRVLRAL